MIAKTKWNLLTDEQLLATRLCDLPLSIEGTPLEDRVRQLYGELEAHNIKLKPHVWLAQEWFTPDRVPGIAIPFYLAHPRLTKLERRQMLEVEGGTEKEFMRILRHEAGHAVDNAFRLHHKKRWRELFGPFTKPYPETYRPKTNSRNFVLHLAAWYAQAHPAEDFAETFAVWLTPNSRWRKRYQNWPVLGKLEYVDHVMGEIAGAAPIVRRRVKVEPLSEARLTLGEHYRRKRQYYSFEWPAVYDRDLLRIFSNEAKHRGRATAASFLRLHSRHLREAVAAGTGVHQYTINHFLQDMIQRCKTLKLRVGTSERLATQRALIALTVQTMNVVHSGYYRIAL